MSYKNRELSLLFLEKEEKECIGVRTYIGEKESAIEARGLGNCQVNTLHRILCAGGLEYVRSMTF